MSPKYVETYSSSNAAARDPEERSILQLYSTQVDQNETWS